ncbi:MAG: hypothetical protein ACI4QZ_01110 [Eubacteriales bacterium]
MSYHKEFRFGGGNLFWGIMLVLAAVALIIYGVGVNFDVIGIPLSKLLIGALLALWILKKLISGRTIFDKLDIFLPLGLLFIVFEKYIAEYIGVEDSNIISNWIVIVAALLFSAAMHMLSDGSKKKEYQNDTEGKKSESHRGMAMSGGIYIDAGENKMQFVTNSFGETEVFYQNAELLSGNTASLEVVNSFGEVIVHVPAEWNVENHMTCSFGSVEVRRQTVDSEKTLILTGKNSFGSVEIVSP